MTRPRSEVCKVCGAPRHVGVSSALCETHLREYERQRNRQSYGKRRAEKKAAEVLPPSPPGDGWQVARRTHRPPTGVKRIVINRSQCYASQYEGEYYRKTPLAHPKRWRRLVDFFLAAGWQVTAWGWNAVTLEKRATERSAAT